MSFLNKFWFKKVTWLWFLYNNRKTTHFKGVFVWTIIFYFWKIFPTIWKTTEYWWAFFIAQFRATKAVCTFNALQVTKIHSYGHSCQLVMWSEEWRSDLECQRLHHCELGNQPRQSSDVASVEVPKYRIISACQRTRVLVDCRLHLKILSWCMCKSPGSCLDPDINFYSWYAGISRLSMEVIMGVKSDTALSLVSSASCEHRVSLNLKVSIRSCFWDNGNIRLKTGDLNSTNLLLRERGLHRKTDGSFGYFCVVIILSFLRMLHRNQISVTNTAKSDGFSTVHAVSLCELVESICIFGYNLWNSQDLL